MPPTPPINPYVTNQLRQLIYYHLDNNLLKNALFISERLVAYDSRSADNAYLLALCHHRLGDDRSAYEYAKPLQGKWNNLGCAYVFALACLSLGKDQQKEGITALEKSRGLWGGRNSFGKHTQLSRQCLPDAAAVNCVLGKLYQMLGDTRRAISYFEEALKLNPFMWDAFLGLCDLGANVRVSNIFKLSSEMEAVMKQTSGENVLAPRDTSDNAQNKSRGHIVSDVADPFTTTNTTTKSSFAGGLFGSLGLSQKLTESNPSLSNIGIAGSVDQVETPTGPGASIDHNILVSNRNPTAYPLEPPQAPLRRNRTQALGMDFGMEGHAKLSRTATTKKSYLTSKHAASSTSTESEPHLPVAGERKRTVSGQVVQPRERQTSEDPAAPQRRSARLFSQIKPSSTKSSATTSTIGPPPVRELKKARPPISRMMRPGAGMGRVVSGNRKILPEDPMDIEPKETFRAQPLPVPAPAAPPPIIRTSMDSESSKHEDAFRILLVLFKKLGNGYYALSQFKCQDALTYLGALERPQQDTPWVLALQGKSHFEMAQYADAEPFYKRIRTIAPTRFEDMEIYSTILWHLKKETDLSFLAHELIDASWSSPYAWCALGNSWSLARDHETALKCFKRATQLSPGFAYAYTLQGHEHVANEEFDKALTAYRQGLAAERRHYNAWYGVGKVLERLGKWEQALKHYQGAAGINPTNAVLIFCIGAVYEKRKDPKTALLYFTRACEMSPRNSLARYKKARVLMQLGDMESALVELLELKQQAPDEGMVWFLLGKLYRSLAGGSRGELERSRWRGEAVRCFTVALNLDPKANQQIKEAIESLEDDEATMEDDDEMSMIG